MAIRFLNSGNISGNLEVNKSANAAVEIAKFKVTGTGGSFGAFSFVSILPGSGNYATQLRLHTNNTGNNFQSINNNAGVLELATNDNNPLVLKTNSTTRLTISNVGAATFTGLVSGITPTAAANFVTKAYADGLAPGSGVFLPLAGGTLTGATATATGISFTVGGHFNANSTTTLGGAVTIEGNLFMDGYNITSIDELSASTGTFSGMITVQGGGIDIDNNDDLRLRFDNASVFKAGLQVPTTAGDMITGSAINDFAIRSQSNMLFATGGATERMRIDSAGNTTVYNDFIISNGSPEFYMTTGATHYNWLLAAQESINGAFQISSQPAAGGSYDNHLIILGGSGNIGIGTNSPNGKLQFENSANTRKIVLYEGANNDYEFYGFGVESQKLIYSVYTNTDDHVFVSGVNSTSRNELMRIEGGGNVGIGTDNPGEKLEVNGVIQIKRAGDHPAIRFIEDTTTRGYIGVGDWAINGLLDADLGISSAGTGSLVLGTNSGNGRVYIINGGNVGIGTTSPSGPLHVKSNNTIVEIESSGNLQNSAIGFTTTTDARYEIGTNISGGTNFELYDRIAGTARISFMQGGTVGIGTLTPVAKLEVAGSLKVTAYTSSIGASPGVSLGYNSASNIALLETWGSKPLQTMTYGYQSFHTNGVERMRILGVIGSGATAGNVGIGTDAPQVNLHINEDTSNSYGKLRLEGSNRGGIIEMYNQTSYPVSSWTTDQSGNTFFATSGAFAATSLSTKFTILTAGNVGIGTTSPSSKLVVAGDTQILTSIIGASKNYATSQGWLPGAAGTFSSQTGYYGGDFSINGAASENSLIWGENGFGQRALQWQTIGEAASDADGGWNKGISGLPDGNTHAYMSYVYVKRTSTATTGTFYYGCATVLNLSGSANSNPYFHVHNIGSLPQDVWCVAIGIIQAHTDTNTGTPSIVGIYRVDTGVKILGGTSFRSISGVQTTQSHRTYHYYSTNPAATLAFANPGFYVIDGTEPNLSTLVNQ